MEGSGGNMIILFFAEKKMTDCLLGVFSLKHNCAALHKRGHLGISGTKSLVAG